MFLFLGFDVFVFRADFFVCHVSCCVVFAWGHCCSNPPPLLHFPCPQLQSSVTLSDSSKKLHTAFHSPGPESVSFFA